MTLHPAAVARYLAQVEDLSSVLAASGDISAGSAAASFREIVESVIVHPVPARAPLEIEVRGFLAAVTNDRGMKPACRVSGYQVVAEEGSAPSQLSNLLTYNDIRLIHDPRVIHLTH